MKAAVLFKDGFEELEASSDPKVRAFFKEK